MKKMIAAAATALFAASMVTTAFADDVSVRTSVGSGEVVFTETSEAADISAEDLTALVKEAIKTLDENTEINAFLDAEAVISLKLGEENEMNINGSAIGTLNRNGDDEYGSLFYSLDGFGDPQSGKVEAYHWVDGDKHYTAQSDGSGWTVKEEDAISQALEELAKSMEAEQVQKLSLDGLLPNLYEADGEKFYVCLYNRDSFMSTVGSVEGAEMYASIAEGLLGDNDFQFVVVVNAETGLLRALSLDASNAAGQIPGEMIGAQGALDFSASDLYVTLLVDTVPQTVEIPEEVLNTPVAEAGALDVDIDSLLSGLGMGGSAE